MFTVFLLYEFIGCVAHHDGSIVLLHSRAIPEPGYQTHLGISSTLACRWLRTCYLLTALVACIGVCAQ